MNDILEVIDICTKNFCYDEINMTTAMGFTAVVMILWNEPNEEEKESLKIFDNKGYDIIIKGKEVIILDLVLEEHSK